MKKHFLFLVITALLTTGAFTLSLAGDALAQGGPPWSGQGQGQGYGRRGPGYGNCPNYQGDQSGYQQGGPRRNQNWNCPRWGTGQTPGTSQGQQAPAPQSGK